MDGHGVSLEKMTFEQKCGRSQSDTGKYLGEEAEGTTASVKALRWGCALRV